jgi:Methyltransferase domain
MGRNDPQRRPVLLFGRKVARAILRIPYFALRPAYRPVAGWVATSPSTRDPKLIWYLIKTRGFRETLLARCSEDYYSYAEYIPSYHAFADALYDTLAPPSACDFGCGCGYIIERLLNQYGVDVAGLDSSDVFLRHLSSSVARRVQIADLSVPLRLNRLFDTVISTEVAEHLPHRKSEVFVQNLVSAATRYIVFTAARPGQWGDGHINCRPQEYWIRRFESCGWTYDKEVTARMKSRLQQGTDVMAPATWLYDNLMMFSRPSLKNITRPLA